MECKLMPGIYVPLQSCLVTEVLACTSPLVTRKIGTTHSNCVSPSH